MHVASEYSYSPRTLRETAAPEEIVMSVIELVNACDMIVGQEGEWYAGLYRER